MLTIEDGSKVTGSDSYVSRADYIAYALSFGVVVADADAADVELRKAAKYIDAHEANLKGLKMSKTQSMAYPRSGVYVDSWYWNSDEIPRNVILAQLAFALDVNSGIDLYNVPANPNLIAKKKRVEGAVSVELAVKDGGNQKATRSSTGDSLLATLLKQSGLYSVNLVRA